MTWNPVTGCDPISEGCEHCYARAIALRFKGGDFKVRLHPERLEQPFSVRGPKRIFICSMCDLFHPDVPDSFIWDVFKTISIAERHIFIILTKRPIRMKDFIEKAGNVRENLWLGVTAENQKRANERIRILLGIPAAVGCEIYETKA